MSTWLRLTLGWLPLKFEFLQSVMIDPELNIQSIL